MQLVTCHEGILKGVQKDGYAAFFGIPYAKAPVGELRWKAPQPPEKWEGVRNAGHFGHRAWQMVQTPPPEGTPGINYYREFYTDPNFMPEMDEDCLYLNIWTPAEKGDEKLPVAFWVHGGAFINGFGSEIEFDGEAFAKKGVILVTINYRLGAFGFLAHPALSAENEKGLSGNYGILDQIAALKWVHENIAAFGGDPKRITVFGQSAGSMSVQTLLSSPLTKGLIAGAVLQSAGGYPAGLNRDRTLREAEEMGEKFAESCGAASLSELRALSPEKIMAAVGPMMMEGMRSGKGLPFIPVIDGYLLKKGYNQVVDDGEIPDIPYMIGSCGDDIGVTPEQKASGEKSALYYACINWSLKNLTLGRKPAYVYYFDRKLLGSEDGAFHSSELWYVFKTLERSWRPKDETDFRLAEEMNSYWVNFMKTGDPNGEGLPEWKPCGWENHHVQILK